MLKININNEIERLLQYGVQKKLIDKLDIAFTRNRILEVLGLKEFTKVVVKEEVLESPTEILELILDWALENGEIEKNTVTYRDLFDAKIMGCLMARPSEIIKKFNETALGEGIEVATKNYYKMSMDSNYIRMDRIEKNKHWYSPTEYGDLEITINLSKPEKDPMAIAAAKNMKSSSYPKCFLCKENEGYSGRVNHPARQNHRIIPLTLTNENWFLQYSPYVYYNEHSIIFLGEHKPMKISKISFERLLEFVEKFPHYFIGSNADLPIVGGSILSHDHFQGGNHKFAMEKAEIEEEITFSNYPNVEGGIVKWPMSVIRLQSKNREELVNLGDEILKKWRNYSDESLEIFAFTKEEPHNTVTPIARKRGDLFELDIVLRNNRTSEEHPLGIFHPHSDVHNIKKENIGLIEVMGLAVLPGRLKEELKLLGNALLEENYKELVMADQRIEKHLEWGEKIIIKYKNLDPSNIDKTIEIEVGEVFSKVLEDAGVYKRDEKGKKGFKRFLNKF